jgi:hypothetical protein
MNQRCISIENYDIENLNDSNLNDIKLLLQLRKHFLEINIKKTKKKHKFGKYNIIKKSDKIMGGNCCICLDEYKVGVYKRKLSCGHTFHKKCIDKWFRQNINKNNKIKCPICRKIHQITN